jgi:hypothetical protein
MGEHTDICIWISSCNLTQVYAGTRFATFLNVLANLMGYNVSQEINCQVLMIPVMVSCTYTHPRFNEQLWIDFTFVSRTELHKTLIIPFSDFCVHGVRAWCNSYDIADVSFSSPWSTGV